MAGATRPFDAGRTGTANAVAAILLMLAGSTVLMGIITAEALFPGSFNTGDQTVSTLASRFQPGNEVREPSATIFNLTLIASGVMLGVTNETDVLNVAIEQATAMATKAPEVLGTHKRLLFGQAAQACGFVEASMAGPPARATGSTAASARTRFDAS
ncbi:MAG: hypothetical protein V9E83_11675 [Baekduia sp.]